MNLLKVRLSKLRLFFVLFFLFCFLSVVPVSAALVGQPVVDPNHPARMIYNGVLVNGKPKPVILCGPGDPEDFFYNDTENNTNLLISHGAKTTYVMAYLTDFNGGYPGAANSTTFDTNLARWDSYIKRLNDAGTTTVFFFFDDMYVPPSDWQIAVDKIVNKLEHYPRIIWMVAEEYTEAISDSLALSVANRIKAADDYDHLIGVHQRSSYTFNFTDNSVMDMFGMQYNIGTITDIHNGTVNAWNNVSGKKIINYAENTSMKDKDRTTIRRWNWAAIMGGASITQVIWMGRASDPASYNEQGKYDDCARLTNFMESTSVNDMIPQDSLKLGSSQYVLANPGNSYILYTNAYSDNVGLKSMSSGIYTLKWFDTVSGSVVSETKAVTTGDAVWIKPTSIGNELALYVSKSSNLTSTVTVTPSPKPTNVNTNTPTLSTRRPGDATNDGLVDANDYTIWRSYYPLVTDLGMDAGDFNVNGRVEGQDYVIWLQNYGF